MLARYAIIEKILLVILASLTTNAYYKAVLNFSSLFSSIPFFPCSFSALQDEHIANTNQIYLVRKATACEIPSCRTEWGALGSRNSWLNSWRLCRKVNPCLHRKHSYVILDKSLKPNFHNSPPASWYLTWMPEFPLTKDVATFVAEVLWTYDT